MTLDQGLDVALTTFDTVSSIVGGSAVLAAMLPKTTTRATKVFTLARKVVDFLGANIFNAKNAN